MVYSTERDATRLFLSSCLNNYVIITPSSQLLPSAVGQPTIIATIDNQATCALCRSLYHTTHSSMLTSHQIAKQLITRKQQRQVDTSITTSSYEMIDPVDPAPDSPVDDHRRRHFWGLNLKKRGNIHDGQDAGNGRRVVSEPAPSGLRKMSALRRFRFGRHEQDLEEEGDLTISTETVSSSLYDGHQLIIVGCLYRTRGLRNRTSHHILG
jgi:hypothetical protein